MRRPIENNSSPGQASPRPLRQLRQSSPSSPPRDDPGRVYLCHRNKPDILRHDDSALAELHWTERDKGRWASIRRHIAVRSIHRQKISGSSSDDDRLQHIRQEEMCSFLRISRPTLEKHFRRELDTGMTEANMRVAQALYHQPAPDAGVQAQIWWTKTRMGWKELVRGDSYGGDLVVMIVTGGCRCLLTLSNRKQGIPAPDRASIPTTAMVPAGLTGLPRPRRLRRVPCPQATLGLPRGASPRHARP